MLTRQILKEAHGNMFDKLPRLGKHCDVEKDHRGVFMCFKRLA